MRRNVVLNRCLNGGVFIGVFIGVLGGVFIGVYGVRLWCFSILAPSAPI